MNLKELKDLIALIQGTDINELEIERAGSRVKIKRREGVVKKEVETEKVKIEPSMKEVTKGVEDIPEKERVITVTSPIVGTFYRSSSPESKPFVEEGDGVKKGQVLCIIEAMKLMNEIEAEVDGKVVKILIENGHPVEYGEPLFLIEPD
ncbi:MAG: acetyl-CoA carboxylase biotin carboxyl carrier protein [Nitrospirota bacterium]